MKVIRLDKGRVRAVNEDVRVQSCIYRRRVSRFNVFRGEGKRNPRGAAGRILHREQRARSGVVRHAKLVANDNRATRLSKDTPTSIAKDKLLIVVGVGSQRGS